MRPADPATFDAGGRGARPPGCGRGGAGRRPGLSAEPRTRLGRPVVPAPTLQEFLCPPRPLRPPFPRSGFRPGRRRCRRSRTPGSRSRAPTAPSSSGTSRSGDLKDLNWAPDADAEVEPVPAASADGRAVIRHSTAHVLAQAVQELFPGTKLGIGPPVENGFYYDFDPERPFTPEDLTALEKKMQEIVRAGQNFARREISDADAKAELAHEPYKLELIGLKGGADDTEGAYVEVGGAQLTMYDNLDARTGDLVWTDLCRGPHLPRTSTIPAFSLTRQRRRLLAGQREEPAAAAHLRHRVGEQGRPQGLPGAAGRGRAPRPPAARRRAGPLQLPRRDRLRPGRLPPQGRGDQAGDGGLRPPPAHRGGLRLRRHPAHHQGAASSRPPATCRTTRTPCSRPMELENASTTSRP